MHYSIKNIATNSWILHEAYNLQSLMSIWIADVQWIEKVEVSFGPDTSNPTCAMATLSIGPLHGPSYAYIKATRLGIEFRLGNEHGQEFGDGPFQYQHFVDTLRRLHDYITAS